MHDPVRWAFHALQLQLRHPARQAIGQTRQQGDGLFAIILKTAVDRFVFLARSHEINA